MRKVIIHNHYKTRDKRTRDSELAELKKELKEQMDIFREPYDYDSKRRAQLEIERLSREIAKLSK